MSLIESLYSATEGNSERFESICRCSAATSGCVLWLFALMTAADRPATRILSSCSCRHRAWDIGIKGGIAPSQPRSGDG